VVTEFIPQERHQGFPGVLHGGILATLLDETLSRTGALRGRWLMTGRIEVRFKRPAPIGRPLTVWGQILRERAGALDATGAVELADGSVVADARGIFVRLPEEVRAETLARYPEFLNSQPA
jgi:acyl-coenzyme A thioesterase PaaI-like protein